MAIRGTATCHKAAAVDYECTLSLWGVLQLEWYETRKTLVMLATTTPNKTEMTINLLMILIQQRNLYNNIHVCIIALLTCWLVIVTGYLSYGATLLMATHWALYGSHLVDTSAMGHSSWLVHLHREKEELRHCGFIFLIYKQTIMYLQHFGYIINITMFQHT